jgi:gliding motility-associated-like protein
MMNALRTLAVSVLASLLSFTAFSQSCNQWLKNTGQPDFVRIGDLDVSGSQITVEASYNMTSLEGPDIVSKHHGSEDVNYLLRTNQAELTTTNGYFTAAASCDIELNKTYHVAMVYDGAALKFYRNGFLMKSVLATGDMVLNNWSTTIGNYAFNPMSAPEYFVGYINEVRIWNVARTQDQIRSYMNLSLPSPTTQTGLLAYYNFNDLTNKQGNALWNGSIGGNATIQQTNPNCSFSPDSCYVPIPPQNLGSIINDYTPVINYDPCTNSLRVGNGSAYNTGDTVLLIQMQGAVIDSSNSSSFGTISNYNNTGNYEFNIVESKSGVDIQLRNKPVNSYDFATGKVQLIRVPYYRNANVNSDLTCLPWDGNIGGVLVFNVENTLQLNANINVTGKGLRGGIGVNTGLGYANCSENEYYYPATSLLAGRKGEGISLVSDNIISGKGTLANGGGGGMDHNGGAGGGGNGGTGGFGGYQWETCNNPGFDNRGIGGNALAYNNIDNKIFMGGGGGAGHGNDVGDTPPTGGNGGGIIIISANNIINNAAEIISNGADGIACVPGPGACHDGMGGGGSGGTILLNVTQFINNIIVSTKGGKGADMISPISTDVSRLGPGGGGAGGVLWLKNNSMPATISYQNAGGQNGVLTTDGNNPWGATAGSAGINLFDLITPVASVPFAPFTINANNDTTVCRSTPVQLVATGGVSYIWSPAQELDDPNIATPIAMPEQTRTYNVLSTDINNCEAEENVTITVRTLPNFTASNDQIICASQQVQLNASGGDNYLWSPAEMFDDPTSAQPVTIPNKTTDYSVNISENTCGLDTTINIKITVTKDAPSAILPNAFTPNNDGKNDCFGIYHLGSVQVAQFTVYNRWGQIIFETKDPNKCWDGTFKGKPQDAGGYPYIIKATSNCGVIFRKGIVMLVR